MFGALRRCPASLSRKAVSSSLSSRVIRVTAFNPTSIARSSQSISRVAVAAFHHNSRWQQVATAQETSPPDTDVQDAAPKGPIEKFAELEARGLVHRNLVRTITNKMGLETMTEVQTRTINEALRGSDIVGQAKTGTGKTLGFLVPVIQNIINKEPQLAERSRARRRARSDDIRAIIISPTRELAEQIAVEARKLTVDTGIIVQAAVGGTQKRMMLQKTQREGCHILVGTPGRLNDLLSDEYSGIAAPRLSCLVMDEADRLLEAGFQAEINDIKRSLPSLEDTDRQTMMFSATIPREVVGLVRSTLKPGFHYVKCVRDDEEPTHARVPQKVVVVNGLENQLPALYELCAKQVEKASTGESRPFKAIVYFSTTNEVRFASSVFHKLARGSHRNKRLGNTRVFEIHSKLSQAARTTAADNFRHAKTGILISSDVTARGMDFPDVTHVIQIGLPRLRETYIHRLGRTARAGKEGEGWLFLSPLDEFSGRRMLRGLPLAREKSLESAQADMTQEGQIPEDTAAIFKEIHDSARYIDPELKKETYMSLFGAYQSYRDKQGLVDSANALAKYGWGMENPPSVPSRFVNTYSLNSVRGVNVGASRGYGQGIDDSFEDRDPFSSRDPFGEEETFSKRSGSGRNFRSSTSNGGRYSKGASDRSARYGKSSGGFGGRSSDKFGGRSSGGFGGRPRRQVQEDTW